jgi:hypothetical protein
MIEFQQRRNHDAGKPCKKPYNSARTNAENRPARYLQGRFFYRHCGTNTNENLSVFHELAPENLHLPADRVTADSSDALPAGRLSWHA